MDITVDNDFVLDYDEIIRTVKRADVVTFRFAIVSERLLVDNRSSEIDPPLVKLVPRATSIEERFRTLKQLRPRFRLPDKISAIWWPKYAHGLKAHGVWDALIGRIGGAGFAEAADGAEAVFQELEALERKELQDALTGDGYHSLWEK
jgi:hypothetical protein